MVVVVVDKQLSIETLLGSDHVELNDIAIASTSARIAAAISRGRHPKGYRHEDLNEDAVLIAEDSRATLLVVADGHSGFTAAHAAIQAIEAAAEETLGAAASPSLGPVPAVRNLFHRVNEMMVDSGGGLHDSRTTLSVWVTSGGVAAGATVGDSFALRISRRPDVMPTSLDYFGIDPPKDVRPRRVRIRSGDWLLVMTDGVADFLRPPWPREVARFVRSASLPQDLVRCLVETAFEGGAGDNIAVAAHLMP